MNSKFFLAIFLAATTLVAAACSNKNLNTSEEVEELTVNSIAVMPISVDDDSRGDTGQSKALQSSNIEAMSALVAEYFQGRENVRILHQDMVSSMDINHSETPVDRALSVGRKLGTDAVFMLDLLRYQDRDGDKYSVDNPASVAFTYRLLHCKSGELLCSGRFDETQESFSANILSFKTMFRRGFKWITSRQLAKEGLESTLGKCSYLNP